MSAESTPGTITTSTTTTTSTPTRKPRIILGLLTFGPPGTEPHGTRIPSLTDFNTCLDSFQSHGYNEVDTARQYVKGQQESWTRSANWQSRGLKLATKCYPESPGWHSRTKVREVFERSLRELGAERVDIFYLHAPDRSVSFAETLEVCDEMYREGKFGRLGLSNYAAWEVAEMWNICEMKGWVKPSVYQAMYNAITRAIEEELVPCCRKYGIEIVVYNPLAGGVLSGRYTAKDREVVPVDGRFGAMDERIGKMYRERYFRDGTFEALGMIEPVVERHGLTLVEVALRWCVWHSKLDVMGDGNDGLVIGVSSLKQLEGNLRDAEKGPLPEEVVRVLDEAWRVTKADCPLYWR